MEPVLFPILLVFTLVTSTMEIIHTTTIPKQSFHTEWYDPHELVYDDYSGDK